MSLFQRGSFTLHSGDQSELKLECDDLSDEDIETLAWLGARLVGPFSVVEGVPTGGMRIAAAMEPYVMSYGPTLIVDDVSTTGNSLEEQRGNRDPTSVVGLVLFLRGSMPRWCQALFIMNGNLR